jgi:hypothetical protein
MAILGWNGSSSYLRIFSPSKKGKERVKPDVVQASNGARGVGLKELLPKGERFGYQQGGKKMSNTDIFSSLAEDMLRAPEPEEGVK